LQRIARDLPGVKLTMMFRDPAERVYLHWAHMVVKKRPDGKNKYGFDPDKGIGPSLERVFHHHGHGWFRMFVEPGFYDLHLERIHRYFPKENVMVMLHDDLVADPQATVRRFFSFLGVDPNHQSSLIGRTTNPDVEGSPHRPGEAFFAELRAAYADSIDRFADMIGRDLTHWKTGSA